MRHSIRSPVSAAMSSTSAASHLSIIVHGNSAGADDLRRMLTDWLTDMHLRPAGEMALLGRYIGYYKPYATSHAELDRDSALR